MRKVSNNVLVDFKDTLGEGYGTLYRRWATGDSGRVSYNVKEVTAVLSGGRLRMDLHQGLHAVETFACMRSLQELCLEPSLTLRRKWSKFLYLLTVKDMDLSLMDIEMENPTLTCGYWRTILCHLSNGVTVRSKHGHLRRVSTTVRELGQNRLKRACVCDTLRAPFSLTSTINMFGCGISTCKTYRMPLPRPTDFLNNERKHENFDESMKN
jgi:hypothetical protein